MSQSSCLENRVCDMHRGGGYCKSAPSIQPGWKRLVCVTTHGDVASQLCSGSIDKRAPLPADSWLPSTPWSSIQRSQECTRTKIIRRAHKFLVIVQKEGESPCDRCNLIQTWGGMSVLAAVTMASATRRSRSTILYHPHCKAASPQLKSTSSTASQWAPAPTGAGARRK